MRRLRRAELSGVVDDGESAYVARLPDGPIIVLSGSSALIWHAACDPGIDDVVAAVAEATGEQSDAIAGHVEAFVDELLRLGLLELVPDAHD